MDASTETNATRTARPRLPDARTLILCFGVMLTLAYCWMFSAISVPNERSRVYLGVAIVDHQTLAIDAPIKRFGRINDWARFEGRAYTDKAPGSSFLYAAIYGVARLFTQPADWSIAALINLARTFLMLPLGLLGFLVMRRMLYEELELSRGVSDAAAVVWMLGTNASHYAHAFYGHQIVAVALLVSTWLVLRARRAEGARASALLALGAGAAAGLAGFTEYQAGGPCVLLALFALVSFARSKPLALVAFALGAVPFVVVLGAYNAAAFGSPLELSYHHLVIKDLAKLHREGVGGVGAPRAELVAPVLFSLHRGLFTTAPILLLWLPGCVMMWRSERRALAALCAGVGLFYVLIVMGTRAWFGGWSFGPRLITPGFPFMMIAAAWCMRALSETLAGGMLWRSLALAGLVQNMLVRAVLFEVPESTKNPLVDLVAPMLRAGKVSVNLAWYAGWTGLSGMLPFLALGLAWAVWLMRPHGDEARGPAAGAARAAGAFNALAWVLAAAIFAGPTWSPNHAKRFAKHYGVWVERELGGFDVEAPDARK